MRLKQKSNFKKGTEAFLKRTPEQEAERKRKTSDTMKAKIAAEPWRKDKMRETAARTITVWARSDEGRKRSRSHGTNVLANMFKSIPERALFEVISSQRDGFKRGHVLYNKNFANASMKRQCDIVSMNRRCVIEFDGHFHFEPIYGEDKLYQKKRDDESFNIALSSDGWIVIRVSYDTFSYKTKTFDATVIECVCETIDAQVPGVYKIGKEYECYK